nr:DUF3533 domain-containing protein [Rhodococcus sp. (in: high G+C Gram-positive bacteria)]
MTTTETTELHEPTAGAAPKLPTWAFCLAVLVIQLGFVLSFVGAFHSPTPHEISLRVVAPEPVAQSITDGFSNAPHRPVDAVVASTEADAMDDLRSGRTSGVYIVDPAGTTDTLAIASAGGTSVATALEKIVDRAAASNNRTIVVDDEVPLQAGDANGLTGFYLVVGWIIGGYLLAAVLGITSGAKPSTLRGMSVRLGVFLPYAVLSGLGGALVVGPLLGAVEIDTAALTLAGTLIVLASAYTTVALQSLFGIVGIAITIVVFVVLGNPSAGGAYQPGLLPPFWSALSTGVPNGAGTDLVRRMVYFDFAGVGPSIAVLLTWVVIAVAVAFTVTALRTRRIDHTTTR